MPAKFRKDRLLKIAEHLEAGKLGHKKFDFRYFNNGAKDARGCGTSGCAVGEFPIIFPEHWEFGCEYRPAPRAAAGARVNVLVQVSDFLKISFREAEGLFIPTGGITTTISAPWNRSGQSLSGRANRKQVAAAIRRFIAWKEQGNALID